MQVADSRQDMYLEFYEEVCKRTAQLVAAWQCVGFCHGDLSAYLRTDDIISALLHGPFCLEPIDVSDGLLPHGALHCTAMHMQAF